MTSGWEGLQALGRAGLEFKVTLNNQRVIQIRDEERYKVCREEIKVLALLSQDCWRVMK